MRGSEILIQLSGREAASGGGRHPAGEVLRRFMTGSLTPVEARGVVRHLLTGCSDCVRETGGLWGFGDERPRRLPDQASPHREIGVWR